MNSRREDEATCPVGVSSAASAKEEALKAKKGSLDQAISVYCKKIKFSLWSQRVAPLPEIRQF
jgi:hypothetical protein